MKPYPHWTHVCLLLIILIHPSCKKNDNASSANTDKMKIITNIDKSTSIPDTTITQFSYNPDGTVSSVDLLENGGTTQRKYTYSTSSITIIQTQSGIPDNVKDSFVLNSNGLPSIHFQTYIPDTLYNVKEYYFYNSSGKLEKKISSYPYLSQVDTVVNSWVNGDIVKEFYSRGSIEVTYGFNSGLACQSGDPTYYEQLLLMGNAKGINAHLLNVINPLTDPETITYTYDSNSRINGYTITYLGKVTNIVSISY